MMNLIKRIFATMLDICLLSLLLLLYTIALGEEQKDGSVTLDGIPVLLAMVACFVYFILLEWRFQATLGHRAMGLKVYALNGKKITFSQALRRRTADLVDFWFSGGLVALVMILVTPYRRRLGDYVAGTFVAERDALLTAEAQEAALLADMEKSS